MSGSGIPRALRAGTLAALGGLVVAASAPSLAAESPVCQSLAVRYASKTSVAGARAYMAGVTYRSYSPGHGNQIEHAARNGRVFLWYPGN